MARGVNIQNVLGSLAQLQQSNAAKAERERQERERRRQKKADQMRMLGTIAGAAIGGSMGGLQGAQMGASIGGAAGGMLSGEGATSGDVQNVVGGIAAYQQGQVQAEDRALRKQQIEARLDTIKQQQADRSAQLRANESSNRLIIDNNRKLSQDQARLNELQETIPNLPRAAVIKTLDQERPGASKRIELFNDKDFLQRTSPQVVSSIVQNTGTTSNPVQSTAWNSSLAGSMGIPMEGRVFKGKTNKQTYDVVTDMGNKRALPVILNRGRELSKRIVSSPPGSQVRLDAVQEANVLSDAMISHGFHKQADSLIDNVNKANGTAGEKTYIIFDNNNPSNFVMGVGESQKQQAIADFRKKNPKAKVFVNQESNALKAYNGADKYMRMAIRHQLTEQGAETKGLLDKETGFINISKASKIKDFYKIENLAMSYAANNINHPNFSVARDAENYVDTETVRLASKPEFVSQMQLHKADGLSLNEIRDTPEYKDFASKYSFADMGMVDNFIEGIDTGAPTANKVSGDIVRNAINEIETGGVAPPRTVSDEEARATAESAKGFSDIVNKSKELLNSGQTMDQLSKYREIQSLSEEERKRLFNILGELRR